MTPNLGTPSLRMDGPGGPYSFTMTPDPTATPADFFGKAELNVPVEKLDRCAYLVTRTHRSC